MASYDRRSSDVGRIRTLAPVIDVGRIRTLSPGATALQELSDAARRRA